MLKVTGCPRYYTQYMLEQLRYNASCSPKLAKQVADRLEKYEGIMKRVAAGLVSLEQLQLLASDALAGSEPEPVKEMSSGHV